jgi:tetratricopeptide (TPR) repeat protein
MIDEESFNFTIPRQPEGKRVSQEEAERSLLEKLEKVGPNDEIILQELAFFYFLSGREPIAKMYFERLIANTDDPEKRAGYYVNMGGSMVRQQNFDLAIYFYSQAFSLEPENTTTWCLINNNLGFCLNQVGRFSEAEGYCRSAIKIDSECHHAYKNLGVTLAGLGQYVEAARNFIEAARADATALLSMKLLDQLTVEHPEIAGELPDLEKVGDGNEAALQGLAYYYGQTGRQQMALKYLERLVANTDDLEKRAGYYLNMGGNMEGLENYKAAIYFYSQAFSLEPEDTLTWYLINNNLGYCLNQFGRFAEAEVYCRSAIKIDPERHNAYKNMGVSLAGQGQCAEAARNYIKALRANAADPRALKLLEQLFTEHPEIAGEIPDIDAQIQKCQEAVLAVAEYRKKSSGAL